jgi:hypothetical protein
MFVVYETMLLPRSGFARDFQTIPAALQRQDFQIQSRAKDVACRFSCRIVFPVNPHSSGFSCCFSVNVRHRPAIFSGHSFRGTKPTAFIPGLLKLLCHDKNDTLTSKAGLRHGYGQKNNSAWKRFSTGFFAPDVSVVLFPAVCAKCAAKGPCSG